MALIICTECKKEISDAAKACPSCGKPNEFIDDSTKGVGFLLGIGIFVLPIVFSWLTFRKGYSRTARIVSFSWLVIFMTAMFKEENNSSPYSDFVSNIRETSISEKQLADEIITDQAPFEGKLSFNANGCAVIDGDIYGSDSIKYSNQVMVTNYPVMAEDQRYAIKKITEYLGGTPEESSIKCHKCLNYIYKEVPPFAYEDQANVLQTAEFWCDSN